MVEPWRELIADRSRVSRWTERPQQRRAHDADGRFTITPARGTYDVAAEGAKARAASRASTGRSARDGSFDRPGASRRYDAENAVGHYQFRSVRARLIRTRHAADGKITPTHCRRTRCATSGDFVGYAEVTPARRSRRPRRSRSAAGRRSRIAVDIKTGEPSLVDGRTSRAAAVVDRRVDAQPTGSPTLEWSLHDPEGAAGSGEPAAQRAMAHTSRTQPPGGGDIGTVRVEPPPPSTGGPAMDLDRGVVRI